MFAGMFAGLAAQFPGVFVDGVAEWPGTPERDDAGRIITPATPITKPCKVQVSGPTTAMRGDAEFLQTDMRLIIPSASITVVDSSELVASTVTVSAGPHAGRWKPQTATLDTAGCAWTCRGRRVKD